MSIRIFVLGILEEYYNYWKERTAGKMWQKATLIVDESAGAEEEN